MTTEPEPNTPPPGYPVVLDVAGRPCLVVGGGPVAARRAGVLLASGARVTVVSPEVVPAIERMASDPATPGRGPGQTPGTLEIVRRRYEAGEAARYHLVVTATGDLVVDRRVVSTRSPSACPSTAPTATRRVPSSSPPSTVTGRWSWPSPPEAQPGPVPVAPGPDRRIPPPLGRHPGRAARRGPHGRPPFGPPHRFGRLGARHRGGRAAGRIRPDRRGPGRSPGTVRPGTRRWCRSRAAR